MNPKPTCIECGEQFPSGKEVESHIHKKHGSHCCQTSRFMIKHNITCFGNPDTIGVWDPSFERTPCKSKRRSVLAHWVMKHDEDTHCLKCFHEEKWALEGLCDCIHCRWTGRDLKIRFKMC